MSWRLAWATLKGNLCTTTKLRMCFSGTIWVFKCSHVRERIYLHGKKVKKQNKTPPPTKAPSLLSRSTVL